MAEQTVYLETTVISYLAARPSRDLVLAAKQRMTWDWWDTRRGRFDLYVSQFVVDEAGDGDQDAARRRLDLLTGIPVLKVSDEATELAEALVQEGVLLGRAAKDAIHVAVAAVHGVDFLLTWNCKHLANAQLLKAVNHLLTERGYEPPIICTPDELMGD
jgi:predicted nucleic acid-binding protein